MTATYGLLSTHPPTRCGLATAVPARTPAMRRPAVAAQYEALAATLLVTAATGYGRAVQVAGSPA